MAISIMIKPSSSACNLKCDYCFYSSLAEERQEKFMGMMSANTAENIVSKAFEFSRDSVSFVFQGGEPLLIGLEFFEKFIELVEKYNIHNTKITLCVQTNGTLIDEQWCEFFVHHKVLVGVSLDGNKEQNIYRKYPDGSSSFDDVMRGIQLLKNYGVMFNVLSVLTPQLVQTIRSSYRFFKQNNLKYIQYIPCLNPFGETKSAYSLSNDDYENYLNSMFKIYYNDNMRYNPVSIRQFDNYRLLRSGKNAEQCGMNGPCSTQFVVEGNGNVYPCDFYCTDEWLLGNINDNDFDELYNSKKSVQFLKESFIIKDECKSCKYFSICRGGGCKRNRESADYCNSYKAFFKRSFDMLSIISNH